MAEQEKEDKSKVFDNLSGTQKSAILMMLLGEDEASEILKKKGISISIFDARFAKPLDEKLIIELASNHEAVITIEEGSIGGFGSHVTKLLSDRGFFDKGLKFRSMILPDKFLDQDTPDNMYKEAGLDYNGIVEKVENVMNSNVIIAKNKNLS